MTSTNGKAGQVLEYVYWDTNTVASGTLAAAESIRYGSTNQIIDYSLQGQLQLALPDNGTNGPVIYLGNINVEHRAARPTPGPIHPWGW